MTEKPIIFSTPMVKAILEGKKTQTRRVIKTYPHDHEFTKCVFRDNVWVFMSQNEVLFWVYGKSPYQVGDRLWVRETCFIPTNGFTDVSGEWNARRLQIPKFVRYFADVGDIDTGWRTEDNAYFCLVKTPSIFMPRWASRITLEVTQVRVQRIQEINHEDITAEGLGDGYTEIGWNYAFGQLWNQINEKRGYGWAVNPWVWAITFKAIKSA